MRRLVMPSATSQRMAALRLQTWFLARHASSAASSASVITSAMRRSFLGAAFFFGGITTSRVLRDLRKFRPAARPGRYACRRRQAMWCGQPVSSRRHLISRDTDGNAPRGVYTTGMRHDRRGITTGTEGPSLHRQSNRQGRVGNRKRRERPLNSGVSSITAPPP
jgi:hypothetical protein